MISTGSLAFERIRRFRQNEDEYKANHCIRIDNATNALESVKQKTDKDIQDADRILLENTVENLRQTVAALCEAVLDLREEYEKHLRTKS